MRDKTSWDKETILVVDDTEEIRKMISLILLQHGYQVLEASNGLEALEITGSHQEPIHLVLTDVVMPRMDGTELAGRLRRLNPRQRLLFMSGYADDALVRRIEKLAVFLPKPFSSRTLTSKIREVLDAPDHEMEELPF